MNKKSWLIPWDILKKYLESHKHLFEKPNGKEEKKNEKQ